MFFKKIRNWLTTFIELQLVITLLSLPIIIHWGLAVSCMLPLANILFTPLLALFLWCSSIFACCKILHLPCLWITTILDYITLVWQYLLSFATPSWLIGFAHSTIWLSIGIALCIFLLYTYIKPNRTITLSVLLTSALLILSTKIFYQKNNYQKISHLKLATLTVNNKIYLLDYGELCRKHNFHTHIDYTILPELIKVAGITTINTLVLYKPSKKLVETVIQFAKQTNIQRIFVTKKDNCYTLLKAKCNNQLEVYAL